MLIFTKPKVIELKCTFKVMFKSTWASNVDYDNILFLQKLPNKRSIFMPSSVPLFGMTPRGILNYLKL